MKQLIYLFLGLLLVCSCEQDAFFEVKDGDSKLYAFSEITTDNKIKVIVNLAPGLNTEDEYFYPKQQDAQVLLLRDGEVLENPGFRYIAREKAFISQGSFRPEAGVEYGLKISLKNDMDVKSIVGKTTIPESNFITEYLVQSYKTQGISKDFIDFEIEMSIPVEQTTDQYFVLKPFYRNSNGEREALVVKEILSSNEGMYFSSVNEGLLIDADKISEDISLSLVNAQQVPVTYDVSEITFELRTITAEAYTYFKTYARQMSSQTASLSEPVISYSNFENGLGLFSGYASTINHIKL